jgi:uroporphyrinogen-III decarboxylase
LNDRERFLRTMRFRQPDRIPYWECAFWGEALNRWVSEGMPDSVLHPNGPGKGGPTEESLRNYFGFDRSFGVYFRGTVPVHLGFMPGFEHKVISEESGIITEQGGDGVVSRWSRTGHSTRQFVHFPVQNREDFQEIKKRLDPSTPGRIGSGCKEKASGLQAQGAPICLQVGGYYGFARSLMGMENLSMAFYDQPELVEEIFEYRTEYVSQILEMVLKEVRPDFAEFWEDMAYKSGPLVSPTMYRKMAVKHYRRITDLLAGYGVNIVLLDSDGNVDELIPIWLDGGITCIWPLEAASDMDPIAIRKKYGKSLGLIGAIDKRALAKDKKAIYEEVMSKVPFLIDSGGFIPTCDHAVPQDVSLENYQYYLELIHKLAEGK